MGVRRAVWPAGSEADWWMAAVTHWVAARVALVGW